MVEYLTYKGKRYPFRISYFVQKKLKQEHGVELTGLQEQDVEVLEDVLWYALQSGHRFNENDEEYELDLKREDMEAVLDVCLYDFSSKIANFSQGMADGNKVIQEVQNQIPQNRRQRRQKKKE